MHTFVRKIKKSDKNACKKRIIVLIFNKLSIERVAEFFVYREKDRRLKVFFDEFFREMRSVRSRRINTPRIRLR